jgi:hypothetical protein
MKRTLEHVHVHVSDIARRETVKDKRRMGNEKSSLKDGMNTVGRGQFCTQFGVSIKQKVA